MIKVLGAFDKETFHTIPIDFSMVEMENFGLSLPASVLHEFQNTQSHPHLHHTSNIGNYQPLSKDCSPCSAAELSFPNHSASLNSSNTNISSYCHNAITPTENIDLNSSCSNTLRSWGSTISVASNSSSNSSSPPTPKPALNFGDKKASNECKSQCVVCEDKASGKHYGVMTCEGCKSFFKRSIRRNLQYSCRVNNQCSVDRHRRNQCQSCRLSKCFKVGMKKEAVQRGRQTHSPKYNKESFTSYLQNNEFSKALIAQLLCSEPPLPSSAIYDGSERNFDTISSSGIGVLLSVIQSAKSNPHFQTLLDNDQTALVKLSCKELFILHLTKTNFPIQALDLIRRNMGGNIQFCNEIEALQKQLEVLISLQLDQAEYSCLKSLLLFTPDAPGLINSAYIRSVQEKIMVALEVHTRTTHTSQPDRFSKLLLRLSSLRTINPVLLCQIFFTCTFGKCPILEDVVHDILVHSIDQANNITNCNSSLEYPSSCLDTRV